MFKELIEKYGIQQEFAEYIKNPVDLDINKNNFTDSIPSLPADKLKILFRSMPTTIIGNVSVGPGEVLFSILFKNVKKRDSKGDLDIGNLNVEVKASIGAAKKAEDEKGGDNKNNNNDGVLRIQYFTCVPDIELSSNRGF